VGARNGLLGIDGWCSGVGRGPLRSLRRHWLQVADVASHSICSRLANSARLCALRQVVCFLHCNCGLGNYVRDDVITLASEDEP